VRSTECQHLPPGVTEPIPACAARTGTLPPHRWPDSSLSARFIPLHFNFGGRQCGSRLHFRSIAFRRSQIAETVKDSGAPKESRGRDAPHIGQARQYGRETSSGQRHQHYGARLRLSPKWVQARLPIAVRSAISAPPPFRKLHCGGQKPPNSLRGPD